MQSTYTMAAAAAVLIKHIAEREQLRTSKSFNIELKKKSK